MLRRQKFSLAFVFILVFLMAICGQTSAKPAQGHFLILSQAKLIATRLVREIEKQNFFRLEELPRKLVAAEFSAGDTGLSSKEFTDIMVLELIDSPHMVLLNLDPIFDAQTMSYRLSSYEDEMSTRRHGVLLDATLVATGSIKKRDLTLPNGKVVPGYYAELIIKDIRTAEVLAKTETEFHRLIKRKH